MDLSKMQPQPWPLWAFVSGLWHQPVAVIGWITNPDRPDSLDPVLAVYTSAEVREDRSEILGFFPTREEADAAGREHFRSDDLERAE